MFRESLGGEQTHFELPYGPTDFGRTVFMLFFEPDVVGDILDDFFDHCTVSLCTKILKVEREGKSRCNFLILIF